MLYAVRLESQTDEQWREMTVDAESKAIAKAIARQKEAKLVAFSLTPEAPIEPERPADGARDATVDDYLLERARYEQASQAYESQREASEATLAGLAELYEFDESGRVVETGRSAEGVTASRRAKAHFHVHHQTEPYKGVTLASKTSTYDTATDQIRLDAADVSWTTSTLSATDAVVWVNTAGASSTDPIMGNVDFGATVTTTAGTFAITWDPTGIIVFDVT
jgi:hypothetical protein